VLSASGTISRSWCLRIVRLIGVPERPMITSSN
jgi:hypothetical protein